MHTLSQLPSGVSRREFIFLIASMMAIAAFSTDTMLPAFGVMSQDFGLHGAQANRIQWVIYAFMLGFSVSQLIYGPMADRWGRKPIIVLGAGIFCIGTLGAALAPTFELLLWMRGLQGVGMAALRVLSATIVRDSFSGAQMSEVMSMIMMVFILVPVFAPSLGQLLLFWFSWHSIFWALLVYAMVLISWFIYRMPETLPPGYRRPISGRTLLQGLRLCLSTPATRTYATCSALMYGVLMAYLGSSEQILQRDVYGLGTQFTLYFGGIALFMGCASFVNSRWVRTLGVRRMAHRALGVFVLAAGLMLTCALAYSGRPPLELFVPLLALCLFCFSLMMPNFSAISMEPLRAMAGAASSWLGFYTSFLGALLGNLIGQAFNGTVIPLATGFTLIGLFAGVLIHRTEGRLQWR